MKLAFYSAWLREDNFNLDRQIISFLKMKGKKSSEIQITFIPSSSYDCENDFIEFVEHLEVFGIRKFLMLPVDVKTDQTLMAQALSSDLIHLGGGNTFYFLKHLKKSGMMDKLKRFYRSGGMLSGLSAGAIILTPSIHLADYPDFDRDENYVNLKDFKSLKLVPFEFFPHYKNSARYRNALAEYTRVSGAQIIACPDGSGLIAEGKKIHILGKAWIFKKDEILLVRG